MKTYLILAVSGFVLTSISVEARLLKPEMIGDWKELRSKEFEKWTITQYSWRGVAADGGSLVYSFTTKESLKFNVLVANPSYWNEAEEEKRIQVFYLVLERKYYKVAEGSEDEKSLIHILKKAQESLKDLDEEDLARLKKLISRLKSRQIFEKFVIPR